MGIQIVFSKEAVKHLIAYEAVETRPCHECSDCESGEPCSYLWELKSVKLAYNHISIWVDEYQSLDGTTYLSCDANHWGNNRKPLLYILENNNVEYREV